MGKYIDIKYFIISLAIGLFYIYISDEHKQVIILYPTPDNKDEYQDSFQGNLNNRTYKNIQYFSWKNFSQTKKLRMTNKMNFTLKF
jgi:hypothetical protein